MLGRGGWSHGTGFGFDGARGEVYIIELFLSCGVQFDEVSPDMALFRCIFNELNAYKVEAILKRPPDREFN
jgi:hypothetical protein